VERFLIVPRRLVPSFALLARANVPEELVNTASARPFNLVQRSRVNQPDPTFPQSPGIIFEISGAILFAAVWVARVFRARRSLGSSPRLIAAFHARSSDDA
jgi:hypothetical protein